MPYNLNEAKKLLKHTSNYHGSDENQNSHAESVLLQIVFPIVLILAFLVIIKVQALEEKAKDFDIINEIIYSEKRGETLDKLRQSEMELQKQKLLVEFEKVRSERRRYFKMDSFEMDSIRVVKGRLFCSDLGIACKRMVKHLGDQYSMSREFNNIYGAVLDSANIIDDKTYRLEGEYKILKQSNVITSQNRDYLQEVINNFLTRLYIESQDLQYESIYRIILYLLKNDEEIEFLDPKLKEFREQYISEPDPTIKRIQASRLHNHLIKKIESKLKDQDFIFFPNTWEKIKMSVE